MSTFGEHASVEHFILLPGLDCDETTMEPIKRRLLRRCQEMQTTTLIGEYFLELESGRHRAWFRYPRDDQRDLTGPNRPRFENLEVSIARVHEAIRDAISAGAAPHSIGLLGHSQGGAVAIAAALTFPETLGIVCSIAGYLALPLEGVIYPTSTRFFLQHAHQDPIIRVHWAHYAHQWLLEHGYTSELVIDDFEIHPHAMHPRQIAAIAARSCKGVRVD